MGNLSPEEEAKMKKEVKEEFDKIDKDKSGLWEKNEFRKLLEQAANNVGGTPPSEEDFDEAFKEFDKDNSGKISFDEAFKNWTAFSLLVSLAKN